MGHFSCRRDPSNYVSDLPSPPSSEDLGNHVQFDMDHNSEDQSPIFTTVKASRSTELNKIRLIECSAGHHECGSLISESLIL